MSGIQTIDHSGQLDGRGLTRYLEGEGAGQWGTSYATIGIFGPQSSGKSTLLNHVFSTSFKVRGPACRTPQVWPFPDRRLSLRR